MTATALVTMLLAWAIIAFFTIRFFLKVLKTPQRMDDTKSTS